MKQYLPILFAFLLIPCAWAQEQEDYEFGPDSQPQDGVPKGTITKHHWESDFYANMVRDYRVYVPAQYSEDIPAALMVFQDGFAYVDEDGPFRAPIVLDNLIHKKQLPVIIGLFVDPGYRQGLRPDNLYHSQNRSTEYDVLSDRYVTFLIDEIIAEIDKKYNLTTDPNLRAICGFSSGGICAFTAAWHRPDYFHRVMSHSGSFTNIRGGHQYPTLIRSSPTKDIKVFLQCGTHDLDLVYGNWWLSNLQMQSALKFKAYDYKFVSGTGGHDGKHGGAILPESLRWLWSDVIDTSSNQTETETETKPRESEETNKPAQAKPPVRQTNNIITFTGTVAFKNFEGGFFAIDADNGRKFNPTNLPPAFRKNGMRVRVTARLKQGAIGFRMYGSIIEIVNITAQ